MYFWRHLGNRLTGKYLVNKEVFRTFGEAEEILYRDTDGLNSKMRVYLTPDEVFEILRKEKGRKYFKKEKYTTDKPNEVASLLRAVKNSEVEPTFEEPVFIYEIFAGQTGQTHYFDVYFLFPDCIYPVYKIKVKWEREIGKAVRK